MPEYNGITFKLLPEDEKLKFRNEKMCKNCYSLDCGDVIIFIIETLIGKPFLKTKWLLPCRLTLSGYNQESNLAIDGMCQRNCSRPRCGKSCPSDQCVEKRDNFKLKKEECKLLGIDLIAIDFNATFDEYQKFIEEELIRRGYNTHSDIDWKDAKQLYKLRGRAPPKKVDNYSCNLL